MRLDLTSFAFGFKIADSAGNPNWATSLGQGAEYKINEENSVNEVLKGLIYSSIPLSSVQTKIGKGGKLYRGDDPQAAIVLASEFKKVFVNGQKVKKCRLILLLTRDTSKSHEGRLRLKYSPNNSLINGRGDVVYSNADELAEIRSTLNISASACWFVYAFDVINQDELHLSVGVASSKKASTYKSTETLHKHWLSLIPNVEPQQFNGELGTKKVSSAVIPSEPLDVVLRHFKEHRDEFAMGKKVNEGIRAYFDPLTEDDLRNFTEEQFVDLFLGKEKYEHMWSGTNGKGWGHIKKCGRKTAMNFIADLKAIPVSAEVFCGKDFEAPNGFGRVTIAELQLKFRPEEFCAYSKRTAAAFRILKLDEREFNGNFSAADYNAVLAITENIRGRMEAMGIGRTRSDAAKPDYLTANEFIDFVVENEDAVRELVGDEPLLVSADALSVALQLFRGNRYGEVWQKNVIKDSYLNVFASEGLSPDEIQGLSMGDFKTKLLDLVWAFQNGGARTYGQLSDAEKSEYKDFVVGLKKGLCQFDAYFPPSTKCPKGMGVGMISELLMRFYPKSCCSYNAELIHDGLVTLGLAKGEFEWPKTPSIYQDFMGKCVKILRKMEEMKFARTPEVGNKDAPDYITVNEFLWFVHDNKDLIKKEVLKMSVKPVKHDKRPDEERKELKLNLGEKDDRLMLRLMAALRTKPFAILAGHSGTGKSRMVRRLAYMTCRDGSLRDEQTGKVGNFCMIQVKPNWHDSTDLLGYYSSMASAYQPTEFVKFIEKAYAYPHVPFFVCLDEMNLAPVEQYFAEYLSAIESMRKNASGEFVSDPIVAKDVYRDIKGLEPEFTESVAWLEKYGLTIPRNLFVVGTVNMDETTNEFSRKVLDRAMTIEMTDVAFENFKKTSPEPTFADCLKDEPIDNLMGGEVQAADLSESQLKNLNAIKAVLASTAFAVAYRFANEYALYADSLARFNGGDDSAAFDHMVLMKVLPRIAGDSEMVKKIFAGLKGVLSSETESHKKMLEIEERDGEDLTFWP